MLQGFVAQCTDVIGNRLVPLDARQKVQSGTSAAAPAVSRDIDRLILGQHLQLIARCDAG
jgi:hypothetical protein